MYDTKFHVANHGEVEKMAEIASMVVFDNTKNIKIKRKCCGLYYHHATNYYTECWSQKRDVYTSS